MKISDDLVDAYLSTEYRVFAPAGTIVLHANAYSTELADLHYKFGVNSSAFITAWNPHSELTDDAVNHKNQECLRHDVSVYWRYLEGEGLDPEGIWPAEPSLFILGIELLQARELGLKFQQHAILYMQEAETRLYACREEDQRYLP